MRMSVAINAKKDLKKNSQKKVMANKTKRNVITLSMYYFNNQNLITMKKAISMFVIMLVTRWAIKKGYDVHISPTLFSVFHKSDLIISLEFSAGMFTALVAKFVLMDDNGEYPIIKSGLEVVTREHNAMLTTYAAATERQFRNLIKDLLAVMD